MIYVLGLLFLTAALITPPSTAIADGVTGGTGIQAIPAAVGIGNNPSIFNPGTGGTQQALVQGSTAYLQASRASKTTNYTLNSELGGVSDCARLIKANGTGAVQFTAPNPSGTLCTYQFGDQSGHGYSITTTSGAASFYGCVSTPVTTLTVPSNNMVALDDDGSNYFCVFSPQTVAAQVNQSQTWGPQYSTACTITAISGVFTPSCPISRITITPTAKTIAVPNFLPPNTASTFINLELTYDPACTSSSPCVPVSQSSATIKWPGTTIPPQCTSSITSGCFSSVALAAGNADWLECRSTDATHLGCGSPLTNMGSPPSIGVINNVLGPATACSGTSCSLAVTLPSSGTLVVGAYMSGGTGLTSITASPGNIGTCVAATGAHGSAGGGNVLDIQLCPIIGPGSTTITANYSSSGSQGQLALVPVQGLSGSPDLGVGNFAIANSGAPTVTTTGSVSTNSLVFVWSAASVITGSGSGYTLLNISSAITGWAGDQYLLTNSSGSQTGVFTASGGGYISIVALH